MLLAVTTACEVTSMPSSRSFTDVTSMADPVSPYSALMCGRTLAMDAWSAGTRWVMIGAVMMTCGVAWLSLIHISEPTRLGMISYAVFCLKKKKDNNNNNDQFLQQT